MPENRFANYMYRNKLMEQRFTKNNVDPNDVFNDMYDAIRDNPIIPKDDLKGLITNYLNEFCIKYPEINDAIDKSYFEDKDKEISEPDGSKGKGFIQKKEVPVNSKIYVVGDIHGSVHSLSRILLDLENKKIIDKDFKIIPKDSYFVFTGDYVDRGMYGAEVWYDLLKLKIANWDNVFDLRGNHENENQNIIDDESYPQFKYCFDKELVIKYGYNSRKYLLDEGFLKLYRKLPLALFVGSGKKSNLSWVQFCHGGLDRKNNPKSFLNDNKNCKTINFNEYFDNYDLTWADFLLENNKIFVDGSRAENEDAPVDALSLLKDYGLKAIFRGHQHFGSVLKLFGKTGEKFLGDGGGPACWKKVAGSEEVKNKKIKMSGYYPIFTITTATEFGLARDAGYVVITTADDYKDWTLEIVEIELPREKEVERDEYGNLKKLSMVDEYNKVLQKANKELVEKLDAKINSTIECGIKDLSIKEEKKGFIIPEDDQEKKEQSDDDFWDDLDLSDDDEVI